MHKPWPKPVEAVQMPVQELADRVLDRLATTPSHAIGSLSTRQGLVRHEVSQAEVERRSLPGEVTIVDSRDAFAAHGDLSRAYGEAWDYCVRQGWLADDSSRPGYVYVTSIGEERMRQYRAGARRSQVADRTGPNAGHGTPVHDEPDRPAERTRTAPDAPRSVTAFASWAHAHAGVDRDQWAADVFKLVALLRQVGVEVDIDLAHLHDDDVDWSTFGVKGIEAADYVLIIASSAYKERWEGTGDPKRGAGAAREANALKALFDDDREAFLKKVKVILLPGVDVAASRGSCNPQRSGSRSRPSTRPR